MYSEAFMMEMANPFNIAWSDLDSFCPDDEKSIDDDYMAYCMGGEL